MVGQEPSPTPAAEYYLMLGDEAYQAGLQKIEADLTLAEEENKTIIFKSEILMMMLSGWKL